MTGGFKIAESVIAREVAGEMVVLDIESGTYFGLNEVGARIWTLLSENETPADIALKLASEYDVTTDQAETDIVVLLDELAQRKLVTLDG